jgi:molybdopterin converting factor small subunit
MEIKIVPIGYLRAPFENEITVLIVRDGSSIKEVLKGLPIRKDLVLAVVVNDVTAGMDTVLADGDIIKLIPVISGG